MTDLKKRVRRRLAYSPTARRLVVELIPGDLISIREQGRRYRVVEPLQAVYSWMVKRDVEQRRMKAAQERKARRAARGRA